MENIKKFGIGTDPDRHFEPIVKAELSKIRKGIIATIIHGKAGGNPPGSTVKILSSPGEVNDRLFAIIGKRTHEQSMEQILCERIYNQDMKFTATYNNKPCFYEYISDLRPATSIEKRRRKIRIKS